MLVTESFREARRKELFEYIKLRLREIRKRYPDNLVINGEVFYWVDLYSSKVLSMPTLRCDDDRGISKVLLPSLEFERAIESFQEITPDTFAFIKWCLDGFESWLELMYAQARKGGEL